MLYLLLQYVVAIGGMTAVGVVVWKLLKRQEAREQRAAGESERQSDA